MINQLFVRPSVIARIEGGPCGPYLTALAEALYHQGYASDSIRRILCACDKFGRWLKQHGYSVTDADEDMVERYACTLERPSYATQPKAAQGLSHLPRFLHEQGVLTKPKAEVSKVSTEVNDWLVRYDTYLEMVVGAQISTRQRYLALVERFLLSRFGTGAVSWKMIKPAEITEFVHGQAATKQGFGRKVPAVAIRSLLRFLVFVGELRPGLEAVAPLPRQWQHAALPKHLSSAQIDQVLTSCEQDTAKGLRDHAILLLLARLGLRAGEVTHLCLEDIDWHNSQLFIRPGKTHQERCLPLSQEVGEALASYLTKGRAHSSSRLVFLNFRPPFRPFEGPSAVSRIARRALLRADLPKQPMLGAHLFRHSAATTMVCQGASFKDVADVLGHRSLQTTGIYAKLNLASLVAVALPWPGDEP